VRAKIGKKVTDFVPAAKITAFAHDDEAVIVSGQPLLNRLSWSPIAPSNNRWHSTTKVPLRNRDGSSHWPGRHRAAMSPNAKSPRKPGRKPMKNSPATSDELQKAL
jgi:hypothetical protein